LYGSVGNVIILCLVLLCIVTAYFDVMLLSRGYVSLLSGLCLTVVKSICCRLGVCTIAYLVLLWSV
jgi:hypothetical protein